MKNQETGLGKYIYMEWLFPVKDYYCSIRKNEVFFEIIFPLLCALGCTYSYFRLGKVHNVRRLVWTTSDCNLNSYRLYSYVNHALAYE